MKRMFLLKESAETKPNYRRLSFFNVWNLCHPDGKSSQLSRMPQAGESPNKWAHHSSPPCCSIASGAFASSSLAVFGSLSRLCLRFTTEGGATQTISTRCYLRMPRSANALLKKIVNRQSPSTLALKTHLWGQPCIATRPSRLLPLSGLLKQIRYVLYSSLSPMLILCVELCSRFKRSIMLHSRTWSILLLKQTGPFDFSHPSSQGLRSSKCSSNNCACCGIASMFFFLFYLLLLFSHSLTLYCVYLLGPHREWQGQPDMWCMAGWQCRCLFCCHWPLGWRSTPGEWTVEQALLGFAQMNTAHNGARLSQALYRVCDRLWIVPKVSVDNLWTVPLLTCYLIL